MQAMMMPAVNDLLPPPVVVSLAVLLLEEGSKRVKLSAQQAVTSESSLPVTEASKVEDTVSNSSEALPEDTQAAARLCRTWNSCRATVVLTACHGNSLRANPTDTLAVKESLEEELQVANWSLVEVGSCRHKDTVNSSARRLGGSASSRSQTG
eukprot:CAMPEP_0170121470 /NCGR_PEP_ID=MMETSP0020_2-20130122/15916_1 /TAXON_ID=98059 /ORGANISM="Dinobryon sp., Strain UTEXLB2267" /LENGTH=152 /DNA_ID=CAMNT_0010351849 /DNA_START=288 /DNA_END=746 /DNA_ORIENTATION=+